MFRNTGCKQRCKWHNLNPDDPNKIYGAASNLSFYPKCVGEYAYKDLYWVKFKVNRTYKCKDDLNDFAAVPEQNGVSYSPSIATNLTSILTVELKYKFRAVVPPSDECRIDGYEVRWMEKLNDGNDIHHGLARTALKQTAQVGNYQEFSTKTELQPNNSTVPFYKYGVKLKTNRL